MSTPLTPWSEYDTQASALALRLVALPQGDIQAVAAQRELAALSPEQAALVLDALLGLGRQGAQKARLALEAVARALLGATTSDWLDIRHVQRIESAARDTDLPDVVALFISPPPLQAIDEDHPPKPDPSLSHLTLGHKKMLARLGKQPDLLARLAAEGDPRVLVQMLINPMLTEPMVVRVCARRPVRAAVLEGIWRSSRWSAREAVRRAIVQNPFCAPALALKLLPLLPDGALRDVQRAPDLHPEVRASAARLQARLRPHPPAHVGPPGA